MIQNLPLATESSAEVFVSSPSSPSSKNARVLHIINGEHFAGSERVQQHLGACLPEFGYDASFACLKDGKFRELSGLAPELVHDFTMNNRLDLGVVGDIAKLAKSEEFQLLHAHTPRSAMITAQVSYRTGIPWIYHVHSPTVRDCTSGWSNRINNWVESFSLRSCKMMITVSRSLRREMLRQGWQRSGIAVVPNGVPALKPIDPQSRLLDTAWRFGLIALMRPRKGVEVALQALNLVRQSDPNVELDLIGGFETNEYEEQILALEHDLDLHDCVVRSGFCKDIPSKVRDLDALVLPSLFGEGMPMVVLEAISAGVPVIATQVEGTPEIIRHNSEGLLAEPGDPESLAEQMLQLMQSREKWCELSANALGRHRENFSEIVMAQRVAKVYNRILQS
ncbi:MAG: glycosyltransferase [Planctomycetota bacterium]